MSTGREKRKGLGKIMMGVTFCSHQGMLRYGGGAHDDAKKEEVYNIKLEMIVGSICFESMFCSSVQF